MLALALPRRTLRIAPTQSLVRECRPASICLLGPWTAWRHLSAAYSRVRKTGSMGICNSPEHIIITSHRLVTCVYSLSLPTWRGLAPRTSSLIHDLIVHPGQAHPWFCISSKPCQANTLLPTKAMLAIAAQVVAPHGKPVAILAKKPI